MGYLSVKETAENWNLSERSVRNYCQNGRVPGAFLTGGTWNIPDTALQPSRKAVRTQRERTLLAVLRDEMEGQHKGGIYYKLQIELTYNSNHIEGSKLTQEQTRHIFETNTIGIEGSILNVDDIIETANHFRCIDYVIRNANRQISEKMIKEIHFILKNGTSDSRKAWFSVGDYKKLPNEVGGMETTAPDRVHREIKDLLNSYSEQINPTFEVLLDFHVRFERIHPFQDGNGRVGRLLLLKECLKHQIVPFIIGEELKLYYYRGLSQWDTEKGYLMDTCLNAQDAFAKILQKFNIS